MRTSFVSLLCLLMLSFTGCDSADSTDEPILPRELSQDEKQIIEADNAFGFSLFTSLHENEPAPNIFISPLSVSMALGMTLNGADTETRDEMAQILNKLELTEESINQSYQSLIELLTGLDPKVKMQIANSIWYRQGIDVESQFLDKNKSYFDAEVAALDFDSPAAVDIINDWVSDKTEGLIDSIIEEITRDVIMYIINAIYFKGTWTYEFDPEVTEEATFFNMDASESTVPLMSMRNTLAYHRTDDVTLVDIPYGDSLYSMTVVLPSESAGMDELIHSLNSDTWNGLISNLEHTEIDLFIPRFSLSYQTSLRNTLIQMGIEQAFSPAEADFSRIHPTMDLFITDVIHKSFVEVNEEGTEAAAVTAVIIGTTSVGPDTPPIVRLDRPFLFTIREKTTGTIIFMGKISQL